MKKYLKILAVGFGLIIMPLNTLAANYSITGSTSANVGTYEIKYVTDPAAPETSSVEFEIEKPNDGLKYEIKHNNLFIGGCNDLKCLIKTWESTPIADGTILATIKISNETFEDKTTTIGIKGYEATKTNISLPKKIEETTTTKANLNTDATLSELGISIGTMDQPFSKDIATYNVTGLKDTINTVTITPDCNNNCTWKLICPNGECSISNRTKVNLQQGANQVTILVESEDGNVTKSYVLNIYRGEIELNSPYLANIILKNSTLSPKFDSMQNDYTAIVGLDVNQLDIEAIAEDPTANVLIKNNENLVEGENTVTITVTSSDGQNKQVYTIVVTKELIEEEKKEEEKPKEEIKTNKIEKKKNNNILIIILSIVGLGLIIATFIIIFKIKKNKNKDDDNKKNNSSNNNKEVKEEPKEKTTKEKIDEITSEILLPDLDDEEKQDVDEALDDLMKTKKLELGDLDF